MRRTRTEAELRQLARIGEQKPPTPAAAVAVAKSKRYQNAADAASTLRAYKTELANFRSWCLAHGFQPMPAAPETVGAYLAAPGLGYALPTLRRRVAAIARAHRIAKHPLDTRHRRSARRRAASPAPAVSQRGARPPSPRRRSNASSRPAAPTWPAPATARCC
jgi:hypothetical protein